MFQLSDSLSPRSGIRLRDAHTEFLLCQVSLNELIPLGHGFLDARENFFRLLSLLSALDVLMGHTVAAATREQPAARRLFKLACTYRDEGIRIIVLMPSFSQNNLSCRFTLPTGYVRPYCTAF